MSRLEGFKTQVVDDEEWHFSQISIMENKSKFSTNVHNKLLKQRLNMVFHRTRSHFFIWRKKENKI